MEKHIDNAGSPALYIQYKESNRLAKAHRRIDVSVHYLVDSKWVLRREEYLQEAAPPEIAKAELNLLQTAANDLPHVLASAKDAAIVVPVSLKAFNSPYDLYDYACEALLLARDKPLIFEISAEPKGEDGIYLTPELVVKYLLGRGLRIIEPSETSGGVGA
ncbi:MAG: hypothetical protein Q4B42_01455 [Oscillospiraceae bacterium]|nr:hypothetical protein [Oscillospiraceae bacterium]